MLHQNFEIDFLNWNLRSSLQMKWPSHTEKSLFRAISLKESVPVAMSPELKTMASRATLWGLPSIIAPEMKNFIENHSNMDYHVYNCCEPYRL